MEGCYISYGQKNIAENMKNRIYNTIIRAVVTCGELSIWKLNKKEKLSLEIFKKKGLKKVRREKRYLEKKNE